MSTPQSVLLFSPPAPTKPLYPVPQSQHHEAHLSSHRCPLPTSLTAAPVAEDAADIAARDSAGVSATKPVSDIFKRIPVTCCKTVGASVVNCRAGPGTNYKVVTTVKKGDYEFYNCVKSGECVTIGGSVNW